MSDDGRRKNPLSFFFLKQRHHSVPTKKNPSSSHIAKPKGIFGAPLEYGAECGSITPRGLQVPDPVYRCMNEVIQRGLKVEGIFRLSGAASEVDQLCRLFDTPPTYGKYLDLSSYDIHAIVGTLKKYLRSLPYPVIPTAYHDQFLGATNNIQQLAHLAMRQLPRAHFILLYTIIELCAHIQAHSHTNMMNPEALAVVLAPVCTGLDQSLRDMFVLKNKDIVTDIVQANARWTDLWTRMIQSHKELLDIWSIEQTRLPPVVVNVALPNNKVSKSDHRSSSSSSSSSSKQCGVIIMRKRGGQHYQRKHTSWPMERRTCLANDDYCLVNPSSYDILSVRRRTQSMVNPSIAPI